MPGATVTEELELIDSGGPAGPGKGGHSPGGGGGGGDEGAGESPVPQRTYITGMTVALAGILMFFMALVSAYIVRKGLSNDWRSLAVPRILWLNTLILMVSSVTLARSRKNLGRADEDGFRHWWNVTTVLGLLFLAGQLIAWRQLVRAGVFLATNPSSSFFYVFTAAHGLHLLGGVIALLLVALRPTKRLTRGTATEVVGMYWHFMDGLWVFIFLLLILGR
ncbi:MAG: cytochrome c oxidase subunit 3 [Candidatus Acidiferrales bacterium]